MIDTPNNCLVQAAFCRAQAANASLANVRARQLSAAAAWESLAAILEVRPRPAPQVERAMRSAILAAKRARRNRGLSA